MTKSSKGELTTLQFSSLRNPGRRKNQARTALEGRLLALPPDFLEQVRIGANVIEAMFLDSRHPRSPPRAQVPRRFNPDLPYFLHRQLVTRLSHQKTRCLRILHDACPDPSPSRGLASRFGFARSVPEDRIARKCIRPEGDLPRSHSTSSPRRTSRRLWKHTRADRRDLD